MAFQPELLFLEYAEKILNFAPQINFISPPVDPSAVFGPVLTSRFWEYCLGLGGLGKYPLGNVCLNLVI